MSPTVHRSTLGPSTEGASEAVPVLAVLAGDEAYGFPLSAIREILVPPPLTEVPRCPDHFLGVIAVRGQIITVIDLPKLLHLDAEQTEPYGRVLLVDNGEELIGVAVDRVIQVYRMEPAQIEYASAMSAELSEYVVGVGRVQSDATGTSDKADMLILIDPVSLLGD